MVFYTYQRADGNRFVDGHGTFPNVEKKTSHVLSMVESNPLWLIAYLSRDGFANWDYVAENSPLTSSISFVHGITMGSGGLGVGVDSRYDGTLALLTPSLPTIIGLSFDDISPLTHAIQYGDHFLYITDTGEVVLSGNVYDIEHREYARLALNALPDARMVVNESGQIAVYVGATNQRYVHGVLGDDLEAASLAIWQIEDDSLRVLSQIDLPGNDVFEGISPFWADVDQDGTADLVTTVSNDQMGAQIRVYRADGTLMASGAPAGQSHRWRHQIAWGAFGPNGEMELVDVLRPHLDGVVEFYQLQGDQLVVVASQAGYTSHQINTRNLDKALGGDFNGDGQPEIVVSDPSWERLIGLQHTAQGVVEVWELPLDGKLTTNLSAVTLPDGKIALAAGTDQATLDIWLPAS